ncbi:MAG: hypothetical protein ABFS41_19270 [Myxococcota bacterium]
MKAAEPDAQPGSEDGPDGEDGPLPSEPAGDDSGSTPPDSNDTPPSSKAATKVRSKAPTKAECEARRTKANAAKTTRNWKSVLKATGKRACWTGSTPGLVRRRLRVEAHAELGHFAKCVKEGGKSSDQEIRSRVGWCKKKLG